MVQIDYIDGRVIAAARALTGMSQKSLAEAAQISVSTLKRMESTGALGFPGNLPNNVNAVLSVLENAGIEFIEKNGGGQGLRLKK